MALTVEVAQVKRVRPAVVIVGAVVDRVISGGGRSTSRWSSARTPLGWGKGHRNPRLGGKIRAGAAWRQGVRLMTCTW